LLPDWSKRADQERDWTAAGLELDRRLADPGSYLAPGSRLRDLVLELVLAGPPEDFFVARLAGPLPTDELALIGGNVRVPAASLARWTLLWGMSLTGRGRVPVALLTAPWTAPQNASEKYFDPAPAAMWAVGLTGQDDPVTIEALLERLGRTDEPLWLRGDAVGALAAVTGERFGYDEAAWRAWWRRTAPPGRPTETGPG
jgi:hypothetical protein